MINNRLKSHEFRETGKLEDDEIGCVEKYIEIKRAN